MPEKIIAAVTYREQTAEDAERRNVERVVAVYFSNEWDRYYRDTFYNDTAKKNAYSQLWSDLILALDMAIGEPVTESSAVSAKISQGWMPDGRHVDAIPCYIHRVALDRSSQEAVYHVIYYRKGEVDAGWRVITQDTINHLKAKVVTSFRSFPGGAADFQEVIGEHVARIEPSLLKLTQDLHQKINLADQVAFINFIDRGQTSGLRIARRLIFPEQKLSHINYVLLDQALLPKINKYFHTCLCAFNHLKPRFEKMEEEFNTAITVGIIDATSNDYRAFVKSKDWFLMALQPLKAIEKNLEVIASQKKSTQEQVFLLKQRLIWVIQEAARRYYVDKCCEVLRESKEFVIAKSRVLKAIKTQFLGVVHISHLFRLSFIDLHTLDIERLLDLYHRLLAKAYDNGYLQQNMLLVYQEFARSNLQLFEMNLKGVCTLKRECFELFDKQYETNIRGYYLAETEDLHKNLSVFNEFINLNSCANQAEAVSTAYVTECLQRLNNQLAQYDRVVADYARQVDSLGVEVVDESGDHESKPEEPEQEYKQLAEEPEQEHKQLADEPRTPHPVANFSCSRQGFFSASSDVDASGGGHISAPTPTAAWPRAALSFSVSPSLMTAQLSVGLTAAMPSDTRVSRARARKKATLVDVKEIEESARQQTMVDTIETIIRDQQWWHQQLRAFGGDRDSREIKVPRGIGQMLAVKDKKNSAGLDLLPLQKLLAYQKIARQRLKTFNRTNFFNTRTKATTQRFYQHLARMELIWVGEHDQANLTNFLALIKPAAAVNPELAP